MKINLCSRWCVCLLLAASVWLPGEAFADEKTDAEFSFLSQLVDWGFADYAQKALDKMLLKQPGLKDRTKVIEAKILISKGKLEDAEKLAAELPSGTESAKAMQLTLAKGYDNRGNSAKAQELYTSFFSQFGSKAPEDQYLAELLRKEAFEYAKRMERSANYPEALKGYDLVLLAEDDPVGRRAIMAEKSKALLELARAGDKSRLGEIYQLADELSWQIDISFGAAVVTKAHALRLDGKSSEALAVIDENKAILIRLDDAVKEQDLPLNLSPWAGARFLKGEVYEEQARAHAGAGNDQEAIKAYGAAIGEFFNVYKKYAGSDWASKAGLKAQEIKGILENDYQKVVKVDLGEFKPSAGPEAFRNGDAFYGKRQYAEAVAEYTKVLNQFPETESSVPVLAKMVNAYANLGDPLMVKVTSGYAAERFGKDPNAAKVPLLAAQYYYKAGDEPMYTSLYEAFLRHFPTHDKAGGILLNLAAFRQKAGDMEGRMAYLTRLFENYKEDKAYTQALWMLAWESFKREEFADAARYFGLYLEKAQPGPDKAKGQFAYADLLSRDGKYLEAVKEFKKVTAWLDPAIENNPFNTSSEAVEQNRKTYEMARFQVANTLSIVKVEPEKMDAVKGLALKEFDEFLQAYPRSEYASKAMAGKGRLLLGMGRFDEATATFNQLATAYPETSEGKSANYSLIKAAVESGKLDIASEAFGNMLGNKDSFSHDEFYRVAELFLENRLYEQAVKGYGEVLAKAQEDVYIQRALLGSGQAWFELGRHDQAIPPLDRLMEEYPRSALFFDAKFILAESYLRTERYDEGKETLAEILKRADRADLKNKAGVTLGDLQAKEGDEQAAYASYQRVSLLADPEDPKVRPFIRDALEKGVDLAVKLGRWGDVVEIADQYLNSFSTGPQVDKMRNLRRDAKLKAVDTGAGDGAPPAN